MKFYADVFFLNQKMLFPLVDSVIKRQGTQKNNNLNPIDEKVH